MKPYVLLVRSLIHINLFFRIYEQKTQLVIEVRVQNIGQLKI